jgi:hypothetical protein
MEEYLVFLCEAKQHPDIRLLGGFVEHYVVELCVQVIGQQGRLTTRDFDGAPIVRCAMRDVFWHDRHWTWRVFSMSRTMEGYGPLESFGTMLRSRKGE